MTLVLRGGVVAADGEAFPGSADPAATKSKSPLGLTQTTEPPYLPKSLHDSLAY